MSSLSHYRQELAKLDLEQGNIDQEQSDLIDRHRKILHGITKFDRVAIGRRTSKANEVIEWKAFSWTRLFNRLENVLPFNVKMLSIRPVFRGRDRSADETDPRRFMPVTVEGLARDWDAFFELETNLINHESFGRLEPRKIETTDSGERSFSIQFRYYPDEPVTHPDQSVNEDVAQAPPPDAADAGRSDPVRAADVVDTVADPAADSAERRQLPQSAQQAAEVTDEWAAEAETVTRSSAASTANTQQGKRHTARPPVRRTLPKVQPQPAQTDDEGDPR